jgi:hypothetical protein
MDETVVSDPLHDCRGVEPVAPDQTAGVVADADHIGTRQFPIGVSSPTVAIAMRQ